MQEVPLQQPVPPKEDVLPTPAEAAPASRSSSAAPVGSPALEPPLPISEASLPGAVPAPNTAAIEEAAAPAVTPSDSASYFTAEESPSSSAPAPEATQEAVAAASDSIKVAPLAAAAKPAPLSQRQGRQRGMGKKGNAHR